MNRKGMIANLIGSFVVIMVGLSIAPMIAQEVQNAINCNSTFMNATANITYETPIGETNSFGGAGGDYSFGGYDGKVKHPVFGSNLAIVKSNSSVMNPECKPISAQAQTLLEFTPAIFAITIILVAILTAYNSFRNLGLVGEV